MERRKYKIFFILLIFLSCLSFGNSQISGESIGNMNKASTKGKNIQYYVTCFSQTDYNNVEKYEKKIRKGIERFGIIYEI